MLLHHYMGEIDGAFRAWGFARGGTGAISNAIADAARELGVEIKTQTGVAQILVRDGKAVGVATASGDEYFAPVISSSVDPNLTFMKMLEPRHLSEDFRDEVKRYKYRGSSGRSILRSTRLPNFTWSFRARAITCAVRSRFRPASITWERAYDDAEVWRLLAAAVHRHGHSQPH